MPSIRQKNIAPGSGLGEILIQTDQETSTADYAENFVFPRATRIWLMEMGTCCLNITGTSMAAEAAYLAAGMDGTEVLISDLMDTVLYTHEGVSAYELTADNTWVAERCAAHQPYLAALEAGRGNDNQGLGSNGFDSETNMHIQLAVRKTAITLYDGWAWMKLKVWYPEDE
jgi:hypothetical protein